MKASTRVLIGSLAGCLATAPMTMAMEIMYRRMPWRERYPLPPRQITMKAASRAGLAKHLDEDERTSATLAAHFGFGTAAGATYGAVRPLIPLPRPFSGVAYGLGVWAGAYLGMLPAVGL